MKRYIADGLERYVAGQKHPWHMPGHKRKALWERGTDVQRMLSEAVRYDVTEVDGTDDLYFPTDFIRASCEELRAVYHTAASSYIVNGATGGILTAVAAVSERGDKILVARNCHKSVYNAVQLLGLQPVYIYPPAVGETAIDGPVTAEQIAEAVLREKADAKDKETRICAMVLTSPTYEGILSDIPAIAAYLHEQGIALVVDEAHGAHLPFVPKLPASAVSQGADLVVHSLHKTLAAFTQTALLHVCNPAYAERMQRLLPVFMSSSPSYLLLCSMEEAVARAQEADTTEYIKRLRSFRDAVKRLEDIHILDLKNIVQDESRIVLWAENSAGVRLSGETFMRLLDERCGIVCEMAGLDYIVLISTMEDTAEDFDYLYRALEKTTQYLAEYGWDTDVKDGADGAEKKTAFTSAEEKFLRSLVGTTATDNIYVYPPGSYLLTCGETFTEEIVRRLIAYRRAGKTIRGRLQ